MSRTAHHVAPWRQTNWSRYDDYYGRKLIPAALVELRYSAASFEAGKPVPTKILIRRAPEETRRCRYHWGSGSVAFYRYREERSARARTRQAAHAARFDPETDWEPIRHRHSAHWLAC